MKDLPLVTLAADGYVEFYNPLSGYAYDFRPVSRGDAQAWAQHLAGKSWVTPAHMEQFEAVTARLFGGIH